MPILGYGAKLQEFILSTVVKKERKINNKFTIDKCEEESIDSQDALWVKAKNFARMRLV